MVIKTSVKAVLMYSNSLVLSRAFSIRNKGDEVNMSSTKNEISDVLEWNYNQVYNR